MLILHDPFMLDLSHTVLVSQTNILLFQAPYNTVQYSLIGNARALEYFQVSPATGVVSLIKPVYADPDNSNYEVGAFLLKWF